MSYVVFLMIQDFLWMNTTSSSILIYSLISTFRNNFDLLIPGDKSMIQYQT